jgi:hypothetical protein
MNAKPASLTARTADRQPAARKGICSSWQRTALPRRAKTQNPSKEEKKKMNSQQIAELTTKAIEELAEALEAGHSEALAQYLAAIGRFHKYSLHNVMLIVLQKPDATHVAGFHAWHRLGRHVRKGEKGITIFAPILRRPREAEGRTRESSEEPYWAIARVWFLMSARRKASRYRRSEESKAMPAITATGSPPLRFRSASDSSIPQRLPPRAASRKAGGLFYYPTCPSAEHAAVLAHELAHEFLHHQPHREPTSKTEAEAVAWVVSQAIGLETGTAARDYIQLHRGDAKLLLESLNYIRLAAGRILLGILENQSLPEVRAA